jgi:hypothetical protein
MSFSAGPVGSSNRSRSAVPAALKDDDPIRDSDGQGRIGAAMEEVQTCAVVDRLGDPVVEDDEDEILASHLRAAPRTNLHEIELTLAGEVFGKVVSLIGSTGQVVVQTGPADGQAMVRGVAGAGAMNLNPAVVTVTITSASGGGTAVTSGGGG